MDATTTPRRKRGCLFFIKRIFIGFILFIVALLAAGFLYETVMQVGDADRYPAPGQLVEVDGYTMHIYCVGEGSPTVILENGAGGLSVQQAGLQAELQGDTRVCTYDRAGMGWSEARPEARTAWQIAHELHTLLVNANIEAPYVLVGPSNGGIYVRAFAAEYPDETAGLVLLDPTFERTIAETQGIPVGTYIFFGRIGTFRLFSSQMCPSCTVEGAAAMGAQRGRAIVWETYDAEWKALQQPDEIAAMTERLEQPAMYGDMPMVVINANQFGVPLEETSAAVQAAFAEEDTTLRSLTTNFRAVTVISDHGLSDQRDLIVSSIRDVLAAARTGELLEQ